MNADKLKTGCVLFSSLKKSNWTSGKDLVDFCLKIPPANCFCQFIKKIPRVPPNEKTLFFSTSFLSKILKTFLRICLKR